MKTSAGAPVGVTWSPAESKANVITDGSWHLARFGDWDAFSSGVGGIAGRLTTAERSKLMFLVDPDDSLVVKVVGKSGREYGATSTSYAEGFVTWEAAIETESEVGFSVVPNSQCHWTTDTSVKIDRIWAE